MRVETEVHGSKVTFATMSKLHSVDSAMNRISASPEQEPSEPSREQDRHRPLGALVVPGRNSAAPPLPEIDLICRGMWPEACKNPDLALHSNALRRIHSHPAPYSADSTTVSRVAVSVRTRPISISRGGRWLSSTIRAPLTSALPVK